MSNEEKRLTTKRILTIFLVWNIVLTVCVIGFVAFYLINSNGGGRLGLENGQKYVLYIGTNDKDSYEQEISIDDAEAIVNEVSLKYTNGYTSSRAMGGWVNQNDVLTQEITLVYTYANLSEENVIKIMDEVLVRLNQESILVEKVGVSTQFYYGQR